MIVLNKQDLIAKVAEKTGATKKDTEAAVTATLDAIQETLVASESVQLTGFGTFEVKQRSERQGRNPQTGESITIAASKAPAFKPGKVLREAVK